MRHILAIVVTCLIAGCATIPDPPKVHECIPQHYASFLFDRAGTRVMNCLSYQMPDETFKGIVARCKANGDTWIYLYLANAGDGNPPRTSFYVGDVHAGEIDADKLALMRSRLEYCRNEGLCVVAWLFPDDSSKITANFSKQAKYINDMFALDDLVCAYCLGIELNEYFSDGQVAQLVSQLRGKTSKSIGVHWTIGKTSACGADTLYYQYGFGFSPAKVAEITRSLVPRVGVRFVGAEYAMSSDKEGKALGQAIMGAGAAGVGNGH